MGKPIRILHMIGSLNVGGSQIAILNLYKKIDRNKVQFDFIVDHPNEDLLKKDIENMGGRIYCMPRFRIFNYFKVKKAWKDFFKQHREYCVLHSHVRSYATIFLKIAKKSGLKTIIHCHSTSNGKGLTSIFKHFMQLPLKRICDYLMSCSLKAGIWLYGKRAVKKKNFFVLNNSIEISKFKYNEKLRTSYRLSLNIKESDKVFIHIGRLHASKNHTFLIDSFYDYYLTNKESHLFIVGDGSLRNKIESKIKFLKMDDNIHMLGNREDVSELLNMADCFLFPSKWEGFPLTVVEAQASGLPCLVSNKITSEVKISDHLFFLPINKSPKIWANKMQGLNFKRYDNTKRIIESGFDINATAKWLQDFYLKIAQNNS